MAVVVIDIADEIRLRLGEPALTALTRRFGPEGRCLTCGERFGAALLSVRAYRDLDGITTLVAYHADCAASAWIDMGHENPACYQTWQAAVSSIAIPVAEPRLLHPVRRPPARDHLLPTMIIRPSLEMTRVRQVGLGEAVNADLEIYRSLGFSGSGALPATARRHPAGQAWIIETAGTAVLHLLVSEQAWSASAPDAVISLAVALGGAVAGLTFEHDPGQMAADDRCLRDAISSGDILFGWVSLHGGHGSGSC